MVDTSAIGINVLVIQPAPPKWAIDIMKYLGEGQVLGDQEEARKVRNRAAHFTLWEGVLYRRGFSKPLLRCVSPEETQYVLAEIHERICINHSSGRALVARVMRAGYYWPHSLWDVEDLVKKCPKCQEHAPIPHCLPEQLTSIVPPDPLNNGGLTSSAHVSRARKEGSL
ncbi:uncharacterized protein LOC121262069 [Juglans microcarpa x Juglans regia]|uniref:uncharacterized protein LOC121262069 n=1 Tax=Juglans microcarpa x Juglans regia TaxID=2249226 RepID=UPI001B7E3522|nr:uncharacterized protein LOC121262069 [Juglans microcarpa x Juglans regia]